MFKENYNIIGVMSGTSLDGVDLSHIHFIIKEGKWSFEILESATMPYDSQWINTLKTAVDFSPQELSELKY